MIVVVRDGVVPVVVTLGASHGQAEERGADDFEGVGHDLIASNFFIGSRRAVYGHAEKTGSDQLVDFVSS